MEDKKFKSQFDNIIKLLSRTSNIKYHFILWGTLFFVVIAILWAILAQVDEITFAEGKVVPSSKVQVIQSLDGGIVRQIFVREGQIVNKGENLIQMDETQFQSNYGEERMKSLYLQLKIARLKAEVNRTDFNPPAELAKEIPQQVTTEKAEFLTNKNQMDSLLKQRNLLQQQLNMNKSLLSRGSVSKAEVLKAQQDFEENENKIHTLEGETLNELNKANAELASQKEMIIGLKDKLNRTVIKSPVRGIIKDLAVNTIGGVIKPGMDILEIVPLNDTLLIEAKVKPGDIGFLHPGQKAIVKITAYDYYIYGGLEGNVEQISADTITNEKQETFYKVYIRTNRNYLESPSKHLEIIPGMVATVDIISGKKSIMHYLLRPVFKLEETALREK